MVGPFLWLAAFQFPDFLGERRNFPFQEVQLGPHPLDLCGTLPGELDGFGGFECGAHFRGLVGPGDGVVGAERGHQLFVAGQFGQSSGTGSLLHSATSAMTSSRVPCVLGWITPQMRRFATHVSGCKACWNR